MTIKTIPYLLLSLAFAMAQEGMRPLHHNPHLLSPKNKARWSSLSEKRSSLSLPFYDDFSYATTTPYPSALLWEDSLAYVNDGMGIAPLNIGVASLDGLNATGYPYQPNTNFPVNSAAHADTLTSLSINLFTLGSQTLTPADSVALIFYYQLGGNGDNPEKQDSLMVDFYKPKQNIWVKRVWHWAGTTNPNQNDTIFKRAFIYITDTAYFHDGFRFRFRNKAQTNGNFDVWNIDEVYLDKNRSMKNDTAWIDLAFGRRTSPFLKNYSAMPWRQYQTSEMASQYSNFIRYNGTQTVNVTYQLEIRDKNQALIHSMNYGASNLHPFWTGGWQTNTVHSTPALSFTFPALSDSSDFIIKHYVTNLAGDQRLSNDTLLMTQSFRNYFAFDDGTCENGYYVLGTGGKAVYSIHLNQNDTLRAVRIHFDPAGSISLNQSYTFRLQIYNSQSGQPYQRIFNDSLKNVQYLQAGHDFWVEYELASPVLLSAGDYFIGYQQFVASGITIGLDRNYWFPGKLFYDSGNGWTPSSIKGSLMMRPVFGKKPVVQNLSETEIKDKTYSIYPNPTTERLFIKLKDSQNSPRFRFTLYNASGQVVLIKIVSDTESEISLDTVPVGVYFYEIRSENILEYGKIIRIAESYGP